MCYPDHTLLEALEEASEGAKARTKLNLSNVGVQSLIDAQAQPQAQEENTRINFSSRLWAAILTRALQDKA